MNSILPSLNDSATDVLLGNVTILNAHLTNNVLICCIIVSLIIYKCLIYNNYFIFEKSVVRRSIEVSAVTEQCFKEKSYKLSARRGFKLACFDQRPKKSGFIG